MSDVETLNLTDGELRIFEPDDTEGDLGRMYVLDVLGVSLLVRERSDGTYVHLDTTDTVSEGFRRPLLVEVNNGGENVYGDEPAD